VKLLFGVHREFQDSQGYVERGCLKERKKERKKGKKKERKKGRKKERRKERKQGRET